MAPAKSAPDSATRGFTLVEVMVVVAIMGLLFALAAPNFLRGVQRQNLIQSTNAVSVLINQARSQALASEFNTSRNVEPGGYAVRFTRDAATQNGTATLFVDTWRERNDTCAAAVNKPVNLQYFETANRVTPDARFTTPNGDRVMRSAKLNEQSYLKVARLQARLPGSATWTDLTDAVVAFRPPNGQVIITGNNCVEYADLRVSLSLPTRDLHRTITLNRVATSPVITDEDLTP